jgi:hypothetical protein
MMDEDWDVLTSFFPKAWQELAVSTGALKGLRQDKSAANLLRTLLIHVACGYSLRETAVRAKEASLANLSDVALLKRLRKSRDWLYALCVDLFKERGLVMGERSGFQVRLIDATTVKEPGKTGSLWRIHYSLQVPSLVCDFFKVTATEGEGTGESLTQYPVEAGDYVIADRGYSHARGIHHIASHNAYACIRLNPQSLVMLDSGGKPFELLNSLREITASGEVRFWPVSVQAPDRSLIPVRLCAIRKTEEAIRIAHKKLRRRAVRKGNKLKPDTLFLAEYVMVVSTFPAESFSPWEVLEWYRIRWQIELVFKRFKQIAHLGHLPKYDSESSKAWLYGKLFTALVTEKIITHAVSISPWGYVLERKETSESMA